MSQYNSIINELEVSRRLNQELALQRQHQQLERAKIQGQLQSLRRSRRQYIDGQIAQSKLQYQEKLKQDSQVSEEHLNRKKKVQVEKSKMAKLDFQRQRERLIQERLNNQNLDKQYKVLDKKLMELQTRSRITEQNQNMRLFQLNAKKTTLLKLLEQSRQKQMYHFEQIKKLSVF